MTYRYVIKMDQRSARNDKWVYRDMDMITTVDADTFEEALEEAKRILPPLVKYHEWAAFVQSVTPNDEPVVAAVPEPTPTILQRTPRGFRYRGA